MRKSPPAPKMRSKLHSMPNFWAQRNGSGCGARAKSRKQVEGKKKMRLRGVILILAVLIGTGCAESKDEVSPREKGCRPFRSSQCGVIAEVIKAVYKSPGGNTLEVLFNTRSKTATIKLPGEKVLQLPQVISGSGARYSDGKNTFWEHHGECSYWDGEELLFSGKCIAEQNY